MWTTTTAIQISILRLLIAYWLIGMELKRNISVNEKP
jgi:hypothetical protein